MSFEISNERTKSILSTLETAANGEAPSMKLDDNGVLTLDQSFIDAQVSEAGLDMDTIKKVQELEGSFITANTAHAGLLASQAMGDDKELQTVSLAYNFGHNEQHTTITRDGTVAHISRAPFITDGGDMREVTANIAKMFEDIDG